MSVPNVFANATTSIPLVQLDQNFNTGITLGNTTVYLGNTTTSFGNVTLTGADVNGTVGATTPAAGKFTTINSDTTGNLNLQSNGTTIVALTSAGAAVTGTFSTTGAPTIASANTNSTVVIGGLVGANAGRILFNTDNSISKNWMVSSNWFNGGNFEFTPSTAVGGSTYTTPVMAVDSTGNLLLNTSTQISAGKFCVSFSSASHYGAWFDLSNNGSGAGYIQFGVSGTSIGNITRVGTTSAVVYNTTSDHRIKNVTGEFESVTEIISSLKVHEGNYIGDDSVRPLLLAHEVQEVMPWAVVGEKDAVDADGKPVYQQMDYMALIPILVSGWQQQQAIIKSLTARIAALESKQ